MYRIIFFLPIILSFYIPFYPKIRRRPGSSVYSALAIPPPSGLPASLTPQPAAETADELFQTGFAGASNRSSLVVRDRLSEASCGVQVDVPLRLTFDELIEPPFFWDNSIQFFFMFVIFPTIFICRKSLIFDGCATGHVVTFLTSLQRRFLSFFKICFLHQLRNRSGYVPMLHTHVMYPPHLRFNIGRGMIA